MSASSPSTARPLVQEPPSTAAHPLISDEHLDRLASRVRGISGASRVLIAVPAAHRFVVRGIDAADAASLRGAGLGLKAAPLDPATAAVALAQPLRDEVSALVGADAVVVPIGRDDDVTAVILAGGLERDPAAVALVVATAAGAETGLVAAREAMSRRSARSEHRRSHWARELHDETLQELAAIRMIVERAASGRIGARAAELLDDAITQIDVATLELRRIVADLRPAKLEAGGLREALVALADRCAILFDLEVDYECDRCGRCGPAGDLDPEVEGVIYRVVQEALSNAIRHARATCASIRVVHTPDLHTVTVSDDGEGFVLDELTEGFGITGMRERAALLRGTLNITSSPGNGTTVRLTLPERGRPPRD